MTTPVFLLTDFGLDDTYVGQMKAVLLARAPGAALADLTHGIPAQDVVAGSWAVAEALPWLPRPAVLLAVVDPGVGTTRTPLVVQAGAITAAGPDNGLLSPILHQDGARAWALDPLRLGVEPASATFHGRDLFAPAAAALARGEEPASLGEPALEPLLLPGAEQPGKLADGWSGTVIHVDRFGNLITNLRREHLGDDPTGARVVLPTATDPPVVRTYADVGAGELCALLGSGGWLEIACNGGSAQERTGLGVDSAVRVATG